MKWNEARSLRPLPTLSDRDLAERRLWKLLENRSAFKVAQGEVN